MTGSILLFVPAYNCEKQIGRVIARLDEPASRHFAEVIVVDNQSSDGTERAALAEIRRLRRSHIKVLRNCDNYGLGGSHKVAFAYALGAGHDHVAVLHGDDQGRIDDLLPLLDQGEHRAYDCLLGARFHPASRLVGYSRFRTLGNRVFGLLFSVVTGRRLYDLGAGLNIYRTRILEDGFFNGFPDDLTFNYAMILAHCHLGHQFRFFPIEWREDDQVSNVKMVRQSLRALAILGSFALSPGRFMATDHRAVRRDAYAWHEIAG
jgi:glycosyltransferase involved in cell wall biosynthesis